MTEPLTEAQKRAEFAAPPAEVPPDWGTGDPHDDRLLTVRVQPPWEHSRRKDPRTPRVVKIDVGFNGWALIDPDDQLGGDLLWLSNDMVRDWPVQHYVEYWPVMHQTGRPPAEEPARVLDGDMGEEAFRGGSLPG
jgi:hypothetical protein